MLRRFIRAGAIIILFAGPAAAQDSFGIPVNPRKVPTKEEIARQKATDDAYDKAMKKIPDKNSSTDPWGNVRPTTAKTKQQQN